MEVGLARFREDPSPQLARLAVLYAFVFFWTIGTAIALSVGPGISVIIDFFVCLWCAEFNDLYFQPALAIMNVPCFVSARLWRTGSSVVEVARVWRNSQGNLNWHYFHHVVCAAAMQHTVDMGLTDDRRILDKLMFRGQRLLRTFSCQIVTLAVFADKLPKARGVDKAQLDRDSTTPVPFTRPAVGPRLRYHNYSANLGSKMK